MRTGEISGLLMLICAGCAGSRAPATGPTRYHGGDAPLSRAADHTMIAIKAGSYIAGSTSQERNQAYDDYHSTAGHDGARKHRWFEREDDRHVADLPAFRIDLQPVSNAAYAEFVRDTGTKPPFITRDAWIAQGFQQDYDTEVTRHNWSSTEPPPGREEHPVVLITWAEARAYCAWRGDLMGEPRRLPTAAEYEKAARGAKGMVYPWGHDFEADKLNSQVAGPKDTVAAGSFAQGASPYGMLDAAGNVFQWTATPWPHKKNAYTVKGSAWDDFAGVGRGASMHGRRAWVRHVIVGFRCAAGGD